jgi:hypothetical protein
LYSVGVRVLRYAAASLLALLATMIFVVFAGAALPVWFTMAISGTKNLQDAPAHGGIILFLTLPSALALSPIAFIATYAALRRALAKEAT